MRTIITQDANTGTYYIQTIATDAAIAAHSFAVDDNVKSLMIQALGATDATLSTALSAATGQTFVDDRALNAVDVSVPDDVVTRYIFRVRGDTLEIYRADVPGTSRIETPAGDSVITTANLQLMIQTLGGTEASALSAIAQVAGCTNYPQSLPEGDK